MHSKLADFIYNINIPNWTRRVGQSWDTFDRAPFNLYNVLWTMQQTLTNLIDPRK